MKRLPSFLTLIFIPLYILGTFVNYVFAPEGTYTSVHDDEVHEIVFFGDMMFDRYVRFRATEFGYDAIFGDTPTLFHDADIVIGNLEGPITSNPSVSLDWTNTGPSHYTFTFATTTASSMSAVGITAVTLANNHSMNFGESGFTETEHWLSENGIGYFGAPDSPYVPYRTTVDSMEFVFYAFDTWYARDVEKVIAEIGKEHEEVFVVVYAHWGDEYETVPTSGQVEYAHEFINAGADMVVGSHPHVVQPKEEYHGKWIYYSLGNFIFDQYFSDAVSCGAVLRVDVSVDGTYDVQESFVSLERNGTSKLSECQTEVPFLDE